MDDLKNVPCMELTFPRIKFYGREYFLDSAAWDFL
jgi:hypothetical protein